MAEDLLRQVLSRHPEEAIAHFYLAFCALQDPQRLEEATTEAEQCVHLAPDQPFSHFVMAEVWKTRNHIDKALESIETAIALNPDNEAFYGARAEYFSRQDKYREALESANLGLSINPNHERCLAQRLSAMGQIGQVSEIVALAKEALRLHPNSATAHTNHGWAMLQTGEYKAAQESYAEALRLAPGREPARLGMIKALSAKNFAFRWNFMLLTQLIRWNEKHKRRELSLGMQALLPLLHFVILVIWISTPLFNLWLRFHPFGKFLLSDREKLATNLILTAWFLAGSLGLATSVTNHHWWPLVVGIATGLGLTIAITVPFQCRARWTRILGTAIAGLFVVVFAGFFWSLWFGSIRHDLLAAFFVGISIYWFAAFPMISVTDRK